MLQKPQDQVRGQGSVNDGAQRWACRVGLAAAIGGLYFLAAGLSLTLLTEPDGVAVFWPAAGISVGALIALGPAARLPVAVGVVAATVAANLLGDRNLLSTIVFALCNAGEAVLAAWLINRHFGPGFSLDRFRRVLGLLAAAGTATAVSGIGGTVGFLVLHGATTPVLTTWYHWFASDAVGIVTVAPLLIGLASALREPPPPRRELVEGGMALVALAVTSGITLGLPPGLWATIAPALMLFPLLLWVAARCRPAFAATAVFIVAVAVVLTTTFSIGRFGDPQVSLADRVLAAQVGLLAATLCTFVLAALFEERRQNEMALQEGERTLRELFDAALDAVIAMTADGRIVAWNKQAEKSFGWRSDEAVGRKLVSLIIPPDLRDAHKKGLERYLLTGEGPVINRRVEVRALHKEGKEFPVELAVVPLKHGSELTFYAFIHDITERKRAEGRQELLIAELDHRVKNALACVAAVAERTLVGNDSMDEFLAVLNGRIQSMANAHGLLSRNHWQGVGLADLVRDELAPCVGGGNTTVVGPNVGLIAEATQPVAMVLHELVTNAAKYGALSTPNGRVSVRWDQLSNPNGLDQLVLEWNETGGPPVVVSTRAGYGTSVIRDLIPYELGGTVDLSFASGGVRCRIEIPSRWFSGAQHRLLPEQGVERPSDRVASSFIG
jgi:PAS domain S-box-containing protein